MALTYDSITSTVLGTAATTITFSSIPTTYTDLRLTFNGNITSSVGNLRLTINGNTTATSYTSNYFYSSGTSATGTNALGTVGYIAIASLVPGGLTLVNIDLLSYNTTGGYKAVLSSASYPYPNGGNIYKNVSQFTSTSAITSLTLTSSITMAVGTTATLYGIKAA